MSASSPRRMHKFNKFLQLSFARPALVSFALIATGFLLRFPYFFDAVIDWDESTFIVMGESVLKGYLPYTVYWDNKPPLTFYAFALFLWLTDGSIVGIRMIGATIVIMTALLAVWIARALGSKRTAWYAGLATLVGMTFIKSGQSVMTEHFATLPMLGAAAVLVSQNNVKYRFFLTGLLLGCAAMIRLNIAITGVFVFAWIAYTSLSSRHNGAHALNALFAFSAGSVCPAIATLVPYIVLGQPEVWFRSVLLAPFTYAGAQLGIFDTIVRHLAHAFGIYDFGREIRLNELALAFAIWIPGTLAVLRYTAAAFSSDHSESRNDRGLISVFAIGTAVSISLGGLAYTHYFIMLVPFFAILASSFFEDAFHRAGQPAVAVVLLCLSLAVAFPFIGMFGDSVRHLATSGWTTRGPAVEIAAVINSRKSDESSTYFMTEHIAYSLTDTLPPTPLAVHPSNIARPYLAAVVSPSHRLPIQQIELAFQSNPTFVVTEDRIWYLEKFPAAESKLQELLIKDYTLIDEINGRRLYERSSHNSLQ